MFGAQSGAFWTHTEQGTLWSQGRASLGAEALLWILGEYGLLIEDAPYLLEPMIDSFMEESSGVVQLEMLTAAVRAAKFNMWMTFSHHDREAMGSLIQRVQRAYILALGCT